MGRNRLVAVATAALLVGTTASALAEGFSVSGDVGAVTKYIFRAQSALGNQGASVQGSLGISPDALPELSVGLWYSTIDGQNGDEIDFWLDYSRDLGGALSLSAGLVGYTFVDSTDAAAFDIYGGFGFSPEGSPFSLSTTLYYTAIGDEVAAVLGDDDIWLEVGLEGPAIATITPSVTFQLSRYGEETSGSPSENDDFDLTAVVFGLGKGITVGDYEDLVSVSLNYSLATGEDRNDVNINNEFWAGFFLNF